MTQWRKWFWGLVGAVTLAELALYVGWRSAPWRFQAQLALVWVMLASMVVWLDRHTAARQRRLVRWMLWPSLVLQGLGVLWPQMAFFFSGGAAGWLMAAALIVRKRQRVEYQRAIRALRAGDYKRAVALMSALIEAEPNVAEHYSFRATLHRMRGHVQAALADYQRAVELEPRAAANHVGLAETYLQMGRYAEALEHGERALQLAPKDWSAHFLLGQAAHRQGNWARAVEALERALALRVSQPTSRLLARLWLAEGALRLGQADRAAQHLAALRKEAEGLRLWQRIFEAEQGSVLRGMLGGDVALAQRLMEAEDAMAVLRQATRQTERA